MSDIWAVVMAGGVGSRFWPLSRAARPKQLLPVLGDRSLLEDTVARIAPLTDGGRRTLVVTGQAHAQGTRDAVARIVPDAGDEVVVVEPCGRNTAPCVGLAAHRVASTHPDAVLAVLPADHFIGDSEAFLADVRAAADLAREGRLVTFGIPPTGPETGYGYLEIGEPLGRGRSIVRRFVEKPDTATALEYLAGGRHLWNSGMFFFTAGRIVEELDRHLPEQAAALRRIEAARGTADETSVLVREYEAMAGISIDYGIMERTDGIAVVHASFPWSDVGQWGALRELHGTAAGQSVTQGTVIEIDGAGNVLVADGGLVATVGVSDLVVVHAGDAVLVCPVDRAQDVRAVVDRLRADGLEDYL